MNESAQSNNKRAARVITTAAFISIFFYSFVVSLPAILINDVIDTFSLEGTDEGFMSAMTSLGFMVSLFFTVLIQGRIKKITIIIAAVFAQAVMLSACGISPTFYLFCVSCMLLGFSGGFIDTFTNSAIVDERKQDGTKYLGYLHGLFGVGSLLSPLIIINALNYIDWREVHYAIAIASVIVIVVILLMSRSVRKKSAEAPVREHLFTKADLLAYLKVKRNAALALAGFFSMLTIACTMVWIVRYMTLQYNAPELGALSITVYWIFATVTRFLLAQIIKRAPIMFFSAGAVLSGASILGGIFSGNPVVLCVMMGLFGLCSGHFVPVLVGECASGYEGRTTFTTAFVMFVMCLARIAAPIMMAFTSTQISLTISMMLPVIAALSAMCCGWYLLKGRVKT